MSQLKICPQCGEEYPLDQRFCSKDGSTLKLPGGAADLVGSIIADRYHVLQKLGEGGMGQVYLAEHVKMGRKSAVKVMNPGMVNDADAISRFNREAANASRISHPNVAAIYDFGETADGLIYLAMEYIEGPALTSVIEQQGALPPQRAAEIARQTAEALAAAHDMGIVHRDLKPDNIMIARGRDGGDLVKVVDFGIAKASGNESQKVTRTGLVVGTPEYMSPEQLAGDALDGRSDIYSLALVAFNMFTGQLPFPAETVQESMIMRLTDRPRTLAETRPDLRWVPDIQAVLDRALQRDAKRRYQSAAEFGRELVSAVERIPGASLAGAATQVIGDATAVLAPAERRSSVPPTRIHGSGATVRLETPVAPSRAARRPARRTGRSLVVATGALIVIGVGAAAMTMRGGPLAAPLAGVLQAGQTTAAAIPDSATRGVQPLAQPLVQHVAQQASPAPHDSTATGPASTGPTPAGAATEGTTTGARAAHPADAPPAPSAELEAALASADHDIESGKATKATADRVLRMLDTLTDRFTTDEQRVHAALLRASAYALSGFNPGACDALREIEKPAQGTRYAQRVKYVLENSCSQ